MAPLFETVTNFGQGADVLRRRPYGVIEMAAGRFVRVRLRPWPKLPSLGGVLLLGKLRHEWFAEDRCLLFYDQPRQHPNYLAVKYIVSGKGTSYRTAFRVMDVLDEIARIKRTDALLCELATWRISREMMRRWGWEPHPVSRWRRHYIKRFYGEYPARARWMD
ncbi:MAG TPA: hypothetical protein VJL29_13590 [Thermoguttaceae bacterium]|nr:hypothetical protein [Thermoguttaceae bacterium]